MALITLSGKCPYPVGWHLQTDDPEFNPNTFYSGTRWEQIKGRVLVGVDTSQTEFNAVGKTGGEKTHRLSANEMPNHKHNVAFNQATGKPQVNFPGWMMLSSYAGQLEASGGNRLGGDVTATGGNAAHNNLQPYRTTYMWVRIE